jgi:hypothetical protein
VERDSKIYSSKWNKNALESILLDEVVEVVEDGKVNPMSTPWEQEVTDTFLNTKNNEISTLMVGEILAKYPSSNASGGGMGFLNK